MARSQLPGRFIPRNYTRLVQSFPSLRAEVDEEAWETLNSNVSRSFERPESGRIAVKVINHLGDEVMKVFRIE